MAYDPDFWSPSLDEKIRIVDRVLASQGKVAAIRMALDLGFKTVPAIDEILSEAGPAEPAAVN